MIEKWKIALSKFLEEYEDNDDVVGAVLVGSYATGNNNKNSDIDVQIILRDSCSYQTRGVKEVNGFLIEYFINPVWKVKEYFEKDYEIGSTAMANMLCYGKIIFDLEKKAEELQKLATEYLDKPLKPKTEIEIGKNNYHVWDLYDELKSLLDDDSKYFDSVYYELIDKVLNSYYEYLEIPKLPRTKVYKILSNDKFREKYHIFKVPEKSFIDLYLNCFDKDSLDEKYENVTKLINYYYEKTGGFNIKGFEQQKELY